MQRADQRSWRRRADLCRCADDTENSYELIVVTKHRGGEGVDPQPDLIDGRFEKSLADDAEARLN
jgi:hypothetical protein